MRPAVRIRCLCAVDDFSIQMGSLASLPKIVGEKRFLFCVAVELHVVYRRKIVVFTYFLCWEKDLFIL